MRSSRYRTRDYSFFWEGTPEVAELVTDLEDEKLVWEWEEGEDDEFWEVNFQKSPVTGETIMNVIEFCDEGEEEDTRALWDSLIARLRIATGG